MLEVTAGEEHGAELAGGGGQPVGRGRVSRVSDGAAVQGLSTLLWVSARSSSPPFRLQ